MESHAAQVLQYSKEQPHSDSGVLIIIYRQSDFEICLSRDILKGSGCIPDGTLVLPFTQGEIIQ